MKIPVADASIRPSRTQVRRYLDKGHLLLLQVVPNEVLVLVQRAFERWVDYLAEKWRAEGLIQDLRGDLDIVHRLAVLWIQAGQPRYPRNPYHFLICPEIYEAVRNPILLDVAEELLGSPEISLHGILNGRAKLAAQPWTTTPWHQDGQYLERHGEPEPQTVHRAQILTMWIPLHRTTPENSCLQVADRADTAGRVFPLVVDPEGLEGIDPDVARHFCGLTMPMERGDLLCFDHKTPHRALDNTTDTVRWSLDVRYEITGSTEAGAKYGMVVRSRNPATLTPQEDWLAKRAPRS